MSPKALVSRGRQPTGNDKYVNEDIRIQHSCSEYIVGWSLVHVPLKPGLPQVGGGGGGGGQVEKLVWRTGIRDVPLSCMFLGLSQVGNK